MLTPKRRRPFFSKKTTSNLPFLTQGAQKSKKLLFAFLTLRSCPKLLGEDVQKVSQKLIARIGKEKFSSLCLAGKEATSSKKIN
jgi:hypothetical protein